MHCQQCSCFKIEVKALLRSESSIAQRRQNFTWTCYVWFLPAFAVDFDPLSLGKCHLQLSKASKYHLPAFIYSKQIFFNQVRFLFPFLFYSLFLRLSSLFFQLFFYFFFYAFCVFRFFFNSLFLLAVQTFFRCLLLIFLLLVWLRFWFRLLFRFSFRLSHCFRLTSWIGRYAHSTQLLGLISIFAEKSHISCFLWVFRRF